MKQYRENKSYYDLDKSDLIEIVERLEGTVGDLRRDNETLYHANKKQMSEIVRLRRQIEAIQTETEKNA